jgi:hypothetical protein
LPRISLTKAPNELSVVWPQLYFGLAFTTFGTLMLALSLDRIFTDLDLPWAWFSIGAALFGLGGGVLFAHGVGLLPGSIWSNLGWVALLNSLVVVAALTFILAQAHPSGTAGAAIFLIAALPFAGSGAVVWSVLAEASGRVNNVRFDKASIAAISGAAAGCLLFVPFLNVFAGAPNSVLASGTIFAISAAIWSHQAGGNARRAGAVLVALLFAWVMVANGKMHLLDLPAPALAARHVSLGPLIALILAGMALALLRWHVRRTGATAP